MDQGHHEQAVGARPDAYPFIGDGRVTGAHRINRDILGVLAGFQTAQAGFDRVGVVVFGNAEHHEVTGVFPVRFAELPE